MQNKTLFPIFTAWAAIATITQDLPPPGLPATTPKSPGPKPPPNKTLMSSQGVGIVILSFEEYLSSK